MKMAKGSTSPMAIMESAAKQNPAFKQTMEDIQKYGSPEKAFYEKAKEKGMSDEDIQKSISEMKTTFSSFGM